MSKPKTTNYQLTLSVDWSAPVDDEKAIARAYAIREWLQKAPDGLYDSIDLSWLNRQADNEEESTDVRDW